MRTTISLFIAAMLLTTPAVADPPEVPETLKAHHWKHRVLILSTTPDGADSLALMNGRLEEEKNAVTERDLVVYRVTTEHALAKKWRLDRDFSILLVGKDGTEKFRKTEPVKLEVVFDKIDAMPMRQREMRERQNSGG